MWRGTGQPRERWRNGDSKERWTDRQTNIDPGSEKQMQGVERQDREKNRDKYIMKDQDHGTVSQRQSQKVRESRQTDRQAETAERWLEMAEAHPMEEEVPKGRKTRLSQRQEDRGPLRRGCNLKVRPEAEGDGAGAGPAHPCWTPGLGGPAAQPLATSAGPDKGPAGQGSLSCPQGPLEPNIVLMITMAAGAETPPMCQAVLSTFHGLSCLSSNITL